MNLEEYRASSQEQMRTADLLRLIPRGRRTILDIGARDGYFSRLFTQHFQEVTALDLATPSFQAPGVTTVAGDATNLQFADNSFDCVFCAEVLEHIPNVEAACREISRVASHEVIIGVPFQQDIRLDRTTCSSCGKANPPWGHVNSFTEERLLALFPGLKLAEKSFVGTNRSETNPLSVMLMDFGGNPWGTYEQEEHCIFCNAKLVEPTNRNFLQKVSSGVAARLNRVQEKFGEPHGNWIHLLFVKR